MISLDTRAANAFSHVIIEVIIIRRVLVYAQQLKERDI